MRYGLFGLTSCLLLLLGCGPNAAPAAAPPAAAAAPTANVEGTVQARLTALASSVPASPSASSATSAPAGQTPTPSVADLQGTVEAAWTRGDWATVVAALQEIKQRDPSQFQADKLYAAEISWGQQYEARGDKANAITHYTRAAVLDGSRSEAKAALLALTPTPLPPTDTPIPPATNTPRPAPTATRVPTSRPLSWTTAFDRTEVVSGVVVSNEYGVRRNQDATGIYIAVRFRIRNVLTTSQQVSSSDFSLQDRQGRTYQSDFQVRQIQGSSSSGFDNQSVAPGATVSLSLTFDVAKDATGLTLNVRNGQSVATDR